MTPLNPLRDADELLKTSTGTILKLGVPTVGFFVLLGVFIYIFLGNINGMLQAHAMIVQKVDDLSTKVDTNISDDKAARIVTAYYLRQICFEGAHTDRQRTACDPPPRISDLSNATPN